MPRFSVHQQFDSKEEAVRSAIGLNIGVTLYVYYADETWNLSTWEPLSDYKAILVFISIRPDAQAKDIEDFLKE